MNTKLILLRHGKPEASDCLLGQTDSPLSANGDAQIKQVFSSISTIDCVVSSPLSRCLDSAKEFCQQFDKDLLIEPKFSEMNFGRWDGRPFSELMMADSDFLKFYQDPEAVSPENGETIQFFRQRVLHGLEELLSQFRGKTVLLFTHGGVIRTVINWAINHPDAGGIPPARLVIDHASQTHINVFRDETYNQDWPRIELVNYRGYSDELSSRSY